MSTSPLKHKIVLITGASSGIGKAAAIQFAKCGANLILCARREQRIQTLATELQNQYQIDTIALPLDVTNHSDVIEKIEKLPLKWQSIDILINNAGLARELQSIEEGNPKHWDEMINTNIKGVLYVSKQIIPKMLNKGCGHIINIGSISGHESYPKGGVYCATKHALNAITKTLRMELLGKNIRVSTVDPGAVETEFSLVRFSGDTERAAAVYKGMRPLTPEDIAEAVIYCASCPPHVNISELKILPTDQVSAHMVHRVKESK